MRHEIKRVAVLRRRSGRGLTGAAQVRVVVQEGWRRTVAAKDRVAARVGVAAQDI